jgi:hypothetical protein
MRGYLPVNGKKPLHIARPGRQGIQRFSLFLPGIPLMGYGPCECLVHRVPAVMECQFRRAPGRIAVHYIRVQQNILYHGKRCEQT